MSLLNVQYDLQVKSILNHKTLSYDRDFRVTSVKNYKVQKVFFRWRKYCKTVYDSNAIELLSNSNPMVDFS